MPRLHTLIGVQGTGSSVRLSPPRSLEDKAMRSETRSGLDSIPAKRSPGEKERTTTKESRGATYAGRPTSRPLSLITRHRRRTGRDTPPIAAGYTEDSAKDRQQASSMA